MREIRPWEGARTPGGRSAIARSIAAASARTAIAAAATRGSPGNIATAPTTANATAVDAPSTHAAAIGAVAGEGSAA